MHTKGHAAADTKASVEQARSFIERAEALGEPTEDPLVLFSVLYGFWVANYIAFNGDAISELATQFLRLAKQQRATVALMIGHRLMGASLLFTGNVAEGRAQFDQATTLYDPAEHRSLATRFGVDSRMAVISYRSGALWCLGYPEAALADADQALSDAREIGHAATLMHALAVTSLTLIHCGNYATARSRVDEVVAFADEKGALFWKLLGMLDRGYLLSSTGEASNAVHVLISAIREFRSTGSTLWMPLWLSYLSRAYGELGHLDEAWRCICEAAALVKTSKETLFESEVHRVAGEIALMSPEGDAAKAEAYFARALAVARQQQAKSWELRAAMSMARLWRDQGKRQQAHDLLDAVYGRFTEGFDTLDLRQAKALLDELR
jgi:predicted ATPase